ncbi:MAG: hypothetical protein FJ011_11205, partial [Chloroflexi bacterium]|nr:hypothetical protein [Chloroflexota bacterium]
MNNTRPARSNLIYVVLLVILGALLFSSFTRNRETIPSVDIGEVAQQARAGQVERIAVSGQELTVEFADGKTARSRKEDAGSVVETLRNLGVPESAFGSGPNQIQITVQPPSFWTSAGPLLASVVPVLLLAVFVLFLMRQAQGAGNQALLFGK